MPIFEYICSGCQLNFELLVRGSEVPICPDCGGQQLKRLLSVPAAHTAKGAGPPECDVPRSVPCGMGGCGLPECS